MRIGAPDAFNLLGVHDGISVVESGAEYFLGRLQTVALLCRCGNKKQGTKKGNYPAFIACRYSVKNDQNLGLALNEK